MGISKCGECGVYYADIEDGSDSHASSCSYRPDTAQEAELKEQLAAKEAECEKTWRCFHCGEICKSEVDARNHFGSTEGSEPACFIKAPGEFALLQALRNAEDRLQRYAAEDSDTLRAMYSMQSDHQQALRREEERGYANGLEAIRAECERLRDAVEQARQYFVLLRPHVHEGLHRYIDDALAIISPTAAGDGKEGGQ